MPVAFSKRTEWNQEANSLSEAIRQERSSGTDLIDLTITNPTACGFSYDVAALLAPLGNPEAIAYDPNPLGLLSAREAVAHYYSEHRAEVDPASILLTTGTSEAYSFLFRLLCDAGDEVLVAQPGYPLLDFLATLDDVQLRYYPLFYDFGWWIDFHTLEQRITPRTRAILLVHPNNPTGHATSLQEKLQLEELCRRYSLALIVDEVFLDYSLEEPISSFAAQDHGCLTFVISGISKICALPQMKVSWIVVCDQSGQTGEALARLEVISDTFLSLNAPVEHSLKVWLEGRADVQTQILNRVRHNRKILTSCADLQTLAVASGWMAIVRMPTWCADKTVAVALVREAGIVTHPGSFYGLPGEQYLVLSLLVQPILFSEGITRLRHWSESSRLIAEPSSSTGG